MELLIDREVKSASQSFNLWGMSSLMGLHKAVPSPLQKDAIYELTQLPADYFEDEKGHVHYLMGLTDEQVEQLTDFITKNSSSWN
jgi:hypothetical protein